jgi:hypothetical protein
MKHFSELPTEKRESLIKAFSMPLIKRNVFVDKMDMPFEKWGEKRLYLNRKK